MWTVYDHPRDQPDHFVVRLFYGEGMRLLQNYPGTHDLTWPGERKPGYWWLYEAGTGTNPKYFKHPAEVLEGNNLSERNVAGIIHWALGSEVAMGPATVGVWAPESEKFTAEAALPLRTRRRLDRIIVSRALGSFSLMIFQPRSRSSSAESRGKRLISRR